MVHLLTWPRIRPAAEAATIYPRHEGRKHHFRWLLRWRNLPVRTSPHGLLPAYGLLTACFMPLYTWLGVYGHRIPTDRFLLPFSTRSKSSGRFYETCDLIDRATSSASSSRFYASSFLSGIFYRSSGNGPLSFSSFASTNLPFQSCRTNIHDARPLPIRQSVDLGYDSITSPSRDPYTQNRQVF